MLGVGVVTYDATQDAMLERPSQNFGSYALLAIGKHMEYAKKRSLLKFETPDVVSGERYFLPFPSIGNPSPPQKRLPPLLSIA